MGTIHLGLFQLHSRVAKGGMGEVWRGKHVSQDVSIAVKVITPAYARQPRFLSAFRSEVQAVARLNHPGIVMVFDYGKVSREAEEASEGTLVADSPYLVMEYASQGSLDQVSKPIPWRTLKEVLLHLLDALAHAHARGVIHRDLKPGNVLLAGPEDNQPGLKLTDFGIAHALEDKVVQDSIEQPAGTPWYMAPEQFHGSWREFGPWTDLYAIGCMAYELAAGRLPFEYTDFLKLAMAHLHTPPPPLTSAEPLPVGFEGWLLRLLQKDPSERFQRAVDAAYALRQMSDSILVGERPLEGLRPPSGDSLALAPTGYSCDASTWTNDLASFSDKGTTLAIESKQPPIGSRSSLSCWPLSDDLGESGSSLPPKSPPPPPLSWHRPSPPIPPLRLIGAGLGLYGLRQVPLVNRDPERDTIWDALIRVHKTNRTHLVLLHAPAGFGKSRLAQWICQRAHEVGAAIVLRAVHSPIAGPGDGLGRMVARYLRCVGLPRRDVLERTEQVLRKQGVVDDHEWHGLTELMAPAPDAEISAGVRSVVFSEPSERYALIGRLIERVSRERPVIVWIDDVQWGSDSIGFARHLLEKRENLQRAVLLLLTVRDDPLLERPLESRRLKELMEMPTARALQVGPLADTDQIQLLQGLLSLEAQLAGQVVRRTGGNPLFAVQLVGDWVRRGVLKVDPIGFVLREGEEAVLPDDIHTVWNTRIERVLDEYCQRQALPDDQPLFREQTEVALELAAVLGPDVDPTEWDQACRVAGVSYPSELPDLLISSRLANPAESGWSFIHGMLRESLERRARESGRWQDHNRACASMLKALYSERVRGSSERIGLHLLEAQELQAAIDPLFQGTLDRLGQSEFELALGLLRHGENALDRAGVGVDDRRRVKGWILRSSVLKNQLELDGALHWAERAEEKSRKLGFDDLLADSLRLIAFVALWRGQYEQALGLFQEALVLFRRLGDIRGLLQCFVHLGNHFKNTGKLGEAHHYLEKARELSEARGDSQYLALSMRGLASVARARRDFDRAIDLSKKALVIVSHIGDRFLEAYCWNDLGESQRCQGALDDAEVSYRKAIDIRISTGSVVPPLTERLNLALILLKKGQYDDARAELIEVESICRERGLGTVLTNASCLLLVTAASAQNWESWDVHMEQAKTLLAQTGLTEPDAAWSLQTAGDLAREVDERTRAHEAYELALDLWRKIGDEEKIAEVERALKACD